MKSVYLLDQTVNIHTAPKAWRDKCRPILDALGEVTEWVISQGTVIDGPEALLRVRTGQCAPFDEECRAAAGMSVEQLELAQRQYLAAEAGIKGAKDMELFMSGVIEGYAEGTTDEKPVYKPGPNHAAWLAAKAEIKTEKGDI